MKKDLISKSLLLSFIGVFLCIAMFVGTTLAAISLTAKTDTNTVSTFGVTIKYDTVYSGSFTNNLKGATLFDNAIVTPGNDSDIIYIRITNSTGDQVHVNLKLTDVVINANIDAWKICCKSVTSAETVTYSGSDEIKSLETDKVIFNSDVTGTELTLAIAVRYDTNDFTSDNVTFKINATVSQ